MWRTSFNLLRHTASAAARGRPAAPKTSKWLSLRLNGDRNHGYDCFYGIKLIGAHYCSSAAVGGGEGAEDGEGKGNEQVISAEEAKRLLRLVNVAALKNELGMENKEVIAYSELLRACEDMGVAKSRDEAVAFSRVLDDAGVILLFRDKVYLHPDKVFAFSVSVLSSFLSIYSLYGSLYLKVRICAAVYICNIQCLDV